MTAEPLKINRLDSQFSDEKIIELLTVRAREIVGVIGLDATLMLVKKFGGLAIWVPKKAKPEHKLSLLIGFDAFTRLTRYYGDTSLEIDLCRTVTKAVRNQKIIVDSDVLSKNELAIKYNLTHRCIRRILQNCRASTDVIPKKVDSKTTELYR